MSSPSIYSVHSLIGGDLAPSLGGRKQISQTKISERRIFRKTFPFSRPKFLMTFFSHQPCFSDFPYLFSFTDFPYLYCVKCLIIMWPFLREKKPYLRKLFLDDTFFLLFSYFRANPATLLLKLLEGQMNGPTVANQSINQSIFVYLM